MMLAAAAIRRPAWQRLKGLTVVTFRPGLHRRC
jgi:hypothetical protein